MQSSRGSSLSEKEYEQKLKALTVQGIADYIHSAECKNIVVLTGAGISTSAGIPDFRSPKTGLYSNLEKFNLSKPQDIFDIEYFKEFPEAFYTLAKDLYPGLYRPTVSHYFIKLLEEKSLLLRNFTQNIDCLERLAGINDDNIVEAHGSFKSSRCVFCSKSYENGHVRSCVMRGEVLRCEECTYPVKPDIVFFGEPLPDKFHQSVLTDFDNCDLLIVMGTSLQVEPFASLIDRVGKECPRLLINRECAGVDMMVKDPLHELLDGDTEPKGFQFFSDKNYRDVFLQSTCDEGVTELIKSLGWKNDLEKVVEDQSTHLEKMMKTFTEHDSGGHISLAVGSFESPVTDQLGDEISKLNLGDKKAGDKD